MKFLSFQLPSRRFIDGLSNVQLSKAYCVSEYPALANAFAVKFINLALVSRLVSSRSAAEQNLFDVTTCSEVPWNQRRSFAFYRVVVYKHL